MKTRGYYVLKNILDNCGLSNLWRDPNQYPTERIEKCVELRLKDQFVQEWSSDIFNS